MNIIGTGLSGLVGSRILDLFGPKYEFTNLSLETGIDITDQKRMEQIIGNSDAPWVFHFAAKTDVDSCEQDKIKGKNGAAWKINAEATTQIADICRKTQKHLLYISTDYVFDGKKGNYTEIDEPNPLGWYGITKLAGEKQVLNLDKLGLVVRIANPYRSQGPGKPDFVHKILERLNQGLNINAPTDQIFTPTFIDDIAWALLRLIETDANGIYHVVGNNAVSAYDAAITIARAFHKNERLISQTTAADYFRDRASRPLHASLINDKIKNYGIRMSNFLVGLQTVIKQEDLKI